MARIRTIKPEFSSSEQIVSCSRDARLLFIEMWTFCDDAGVHVDSAKRLKMECFPGDDDLTVKAVAALIDELIAAKLLRRYEVDGQFYLWVTGWDKHQRIERPNSRYPRPPDGTNCAGGNSPNDHRASGEPSSTSRQTLADNSPTDRRSLTPGVESKGREWNLDKGNLLPRTHARGSTTSLASALPDVAKKNLSDLSRATLARAARDGPQPNYADPAVKKQRWEQNVQLEINRTKRPERAVEIIIGYQNGEEWAKREYEIASAKMKRRNGAAHD